MSESKNETMDKLKEKAINIIFDLITNIPDSLHVSAIDPENRANMLTQQAAFKAATVSATLSIPAGFTLFCIYKICRRLNQRCLQLAHISRFFRSAL